MIKRIVYITFSVVCMMAFSCQKATLVDEMPEECLDINGRNSEESDTTSDSITVTPEFDINGWEGSIDADFTFGGEETNKQK